MKRLFLCLFLICFSAPSLLAQASIEERVDMIFDMGKMDSMVEDFEADFIATFPEFYAEIFELQGKQIKMAASTLRFSELSKNMRANFAKLAKETEPEFAKLEEWFNEKWHQDILEISSVYEPSEEEMMAYMQNIDQSPHETTELGERFSKANNATEFILRAVEFSLDSMHYCAHAIDNDVNLEEALFENEFKAMMEPQMEVMSNTIFAMMMEQLEGLEKEKLVDTYETESGQWYVNTYSQAVYETFDSATKEIINACRPE